MKSYSMNALRDAFVAVGVRSGDLVYLSTRLFGVGRMTGVKTREEMLAAYFDVVTDLLGPTGTLVVPTFTQQVGRFGVPYIHEETVSLTGIFGEHVRARPDSVRSLHPVFSVTAVGAGKAAVCDDISPVAFGRGSAFDRMVALGGKCVCIGFDYYSGHIVSLMHHAETLFAVPYYYNKLVLAPVWRGGRQLDRVFVINVMYRSVRSGYHYNRFIDGLARKGHIRSAPIGDTFVYSVDMADQMECGFSMLREDMYAFLEPRPEFLRGIIPAEGPESADQAQPPDGTNWAGFYVGL